MYIRKLLVTCRVWINEEKNNFFHSQNGLNINNFGFGVALIHHNFWRKKKKKKKTQKEVVKMTYNIWADLIHVSKQLFLTNSNSYDILWDLQCVPEMKLTSPTLNRCDRESSDSSFLLLLILRYYSFLKINPTCINRNELVDQSYLLLSLWKVLHKQL